MGGMVLYPMSRGHEALRFFHDFSTTCPDEVTTQGLLITAPDGSPAVAIAVCYSGPLDQGEKILKPLRTFIPPLADLIAPRPYVEMQSLFDEVWPPGRLYYNKASNIRDLSDPAFETLVAYGAAMPTKVSAIYLMQLHGAASRVAGSETAFPHRNDHYLFGAHPAADDPADSQKMISWAQECWQAIQPFADRALYVNALEDAAEEGEHRILEAYGANYGRLVALKNRYDPANLFRLNANIKPTV